MAADPAGARDRARHGRADARVQAWAEASGNTALAGRELPHADVITADQRLTAIARAVKAADAPGTLDHLRAAAFIALLTGRDLATLIPADGPSSKPHGTEPDDPAAASTGPEPAGRSGPGPDLSPAGTATTGRDTEPAGDADLTSAANTGGQQRQVRGTAVADDPADAA